MTYHPHDDLPDDPPSVPGHDLIGRADYRQTTWSPAESFAQCSCGWEANPVATAGSGVESSGALFSEHLEEVAA